MGQIEPEHPELFALEFGKIAENDPVYSLWSTNINQSAPNFIKMYVIIRSRVSSAPNFIKMYVIIRSRMSLIMDIIGPELSELSAIELEKLPYLTLLTL